MPVHGLPPRSNERSGPSARRAKSRAIPGRPWMLLAIPAILAASLTALVQGVGLTWDAMVRDDGPEVRASWTLVLDGWVPEGERGAKGMELLGNGRTDSLLLSGSRIAAALWTSTLHFRSLLPDSIQRSRMGELRHNGLSTLEEAYAATAFFRSRGVDTVLLVTTDFHTDRAASIFARVAGGDPVFRVVAAHEARFAGPWSREHSKTWLLESTKRIHWTLLERWLTSPLEPGATSPIAWSVALQDSAGQSILLQARCPPPVVCPAPVPCPTPVDSGAPPSDDSDEAEPPKTSEKENPSSAKAPASGKTTKPKEAVKAKEATKSSTGAKSKSPSKDKR